MVGIHGLAIVLVMVYIDVVQTALILNNLYAYSSSRPTFELIMTKIVMYLQMY